MSTEPICTCGEATTYRRMERHIVGDFAYPDPDSGLELGEPINVLTFVCPNGHSTSLWAWLDEPLPEGLKPNPPTMQETA